MRYTTIIYEVKKELGISLREYIYLDAVYHLQAKTGWSFAKNEYYGEMLDVGFREIQKISKSLVEKGLIIKSVEGVKTTDVWGNIYLQKQVADIPPAMTKKSPLPRPKGHSDHEQKVTPTIYKESNKKSDKQKIEKAPTFNPLGAEVIKAMEAIDPKNKTYYGNETQREACDFLLDEYGLEKVKEMITIIAGNMNKIFNPPTSPKMLMDNWVRILAENAYKQNVKQSKKPTVMTVDVPA